MPQTKSTQTPEELKEKQQRVLKMLRQATKNVRKDDNPINQPANSPPTSKPKVSVPQNLSQQQKQKFVDQKIQNLKRQMAIIKQLDITKPLQTWNTQITENNIQSFMNMINGFNSSIYKSVLNKFIQQPLEINRNKLPQDSLLQKYNAILTTRKGSGLWNELVDTYYLKALPQKFQTEHQEFHKFHDNSYTGWFGWWVFGTVFVKINSKKQYSRFYQTRFLWAKSLLVLIVGVFGLDTFYRIQLKNFATKNVDIVDTTFDTHLRLMQAHGINIDQTLSKFQQLQAQ